MLRVISSFPRRGDDGTALSKRVDELRSGAQSALEFLVTHYPDAAREMVRVRQETLRHEGYGEPGRLHVMAGTLGIMLDAMEKHNIATPGDPLLKGVDELGLSADGAPRRASQLISDGVTLASINQAILNPEEAAQRVAMLITRYPDAALIALAESGGPLGRSKQANLNAEIQAHFSPGHVPSRTRDGGTSR